MYGGVEDFSYRLIPSRALVAAGYPISRFNDAKDSNNQFTATNIATPYNQSPDLQNLTAAFVPHTAIFNAGYKLLKMSPSEYGFFSPTGPTPEDLQLREDLDRVLAIYLRWMRRRAGVNPLEAMQAMWARLSRDGTSIATRTRSNVASTSGTGRSGPSVSQSTGARDAKRRKRSQGDDE